MINTFRLWITSINSNRELDMSHRRQRQGGVRVWSTVSRAAKGPGKDAAVKV